MKPFRFPNPARALCAAALLFGAASAAQAAEVVGKSAPPAQPKLVVMISVDQFSANLFNQYRAYATEGLKELEQGVVFPSTFHSHSGTETCPGHATLLTGRYPSGTGIVANDWIDRKTGEGIYCAEIPGAPKDARGPQTLKAQTLGDWMKAADPNSRIVAIAGKDRAAIMMAGHRADVVTWWKDSAFVTDDHTATTPVPAGTVITAFNETLKKEWARKAPVWEAKLARCKALTTADGFAKPIRPVTDLRPDTGGAAAANRFLMTPYLDEAVERLSSNLTKTMKLGQGQSTDLLIVGLSATDYVGHNYGPGGAEMCEQFMALDHTLGRLLKVIKAQGVPFVVALSADHGGIDTVERAAERGVPAAQRLNGRAMLKELNDSLKAQFNLPRGPFGGDITELTLLDGPTPEQGVAILAAARQWYAARSDVISVFDRTEVAAAGPGDPRLPVDALPLINRYNRSFDPERSADLFIAFKPFVYFSMPVRSGHMLTGHGSAWDYDRRVPLLVWWPDAKGFEQPLPVLTVDIAPTLAAIAHVPVPVPVPVDGRCLDLDRDAPDTCPAPKN